jgi:hypothetical protein
MDSSKNRPIFRKIQRAKSVILDGKQLFLKECKKCGADFYGVEKQTRCDESAFPERETYRLIPMQSNRDVRLLMWRE